MTTGQKIEDTFEVWEDDELDTDPEFVQVHHETKEEANLINEAFELELVELHIEKDVLEQYVDLAEKSNLRYKTLMRVVLKEYIKKFQ